MHALRRLMVAVALSAIVLVAMTASVGAVGGRPFTVQLSGAAEVPPGDPDGSGTAQLWINPGTGSVCWAITVANVDPIFAAHIHLAPVGVAGPVVAQLNPYTGGCESVDPTLARAIVMNPSAYYVNLHNATYPAGAARGQLSRTP